MTPEEKRRELEDARRRASSLGVVILGCLVYVVVIAVLVGGIVG